MTILRSHIFAALLFCTSALPCPWAPLDPGESPEEVRLRYALTSKLQSEIPDITSVIVEKDGANYELYAIAGESNPIKLGQLDLGKTANSVGVIDILVFEPYRGKGIHRYLMAHIMRRNPALTFLPTELTQDNRSAVLMAYANNITGTKLKKRMEELPADSLEPLAGGKLLFSDLADLKPGTDVKDMRAKIIEAVGKGAPTSRVVAQNGFKHLVRIVLERKYDGLIPIRISVDYSRQDEAPGLTRIFYIDHMQSPTTAELLPNGQLAYGDRTMARWEEE